MPYQVRLAIIINYRHSNTYYFLKLSHTFFHAHAFDIIAIIIWLIYFSLLATIPVMRRVYKMVSKIKKILWSIAIIARNANSRDSFRWSKAVKILEKVTDKFYWEIREIRKMLELIDFINIRYAAILRKVYLHHQAFAHFTLWRYAGDALSCN